MKDSEKIHIGEHESMCNPILQAMLLNEAGTQFNIVLGLCVGHDSLFFRYARSADHRARRERQGGGPQSAGVYLHDGNLWILGEGPLGYGLRSPGTTGQHMREVSPNGSQR